MTKNQWLKYIPLVFIWTVIVDWGTVGGFYLSYWNVSLAGHIMRGVTFLFTPLFISYFILRRRWNEIKLLIPIIVVAFIIEVLIVKNQLLYVFPFFLWGIPLAIIVYSAIVYLPLWVVTGQIKENKKKAIFLFAVFLFISVLSFFIQK